MEIKNSINFKEMVKLIHPDINPNITDASLKMNQVLEFKNNPDHLYKLGVEWGIIKDFDINWYHHKIVSFKYNNMTYTGTVFFTEEITSTWDVENKILHISVETPDYKYLKLKTVGSFIKENINIVRDANTEEVMLAIKIKEECTKPRVSPIPEKKVEPVREPVREPVNPEVVTLRPNTRYSYSNLFAFIRTKGRFCRVTRTSAKSVFYINSFDDKEHYTAFKNVGTVERRN